MLVFMAFAVFMPLGALAQNSNLGVNILQVTPTSATGPVGSTVSVIGTIYTSNGSYQLILGRNVVASGQADGYYVDANFTVPESTAGPFALILRDMAININSTGQQFSITTGYSISASPASVQEGGGLSVTVKVLAAQLGATYGAQISIVLPSPVSTTYTKTVSLGAGNQIGTASATVSFPDSTFQPSGSTTAYAGTYQVYFNQSQSLAQTQFTVNFLDRTTYHRGDTVTVTAPGYQPNQGATITATSSSTGTNIESASVTASADGVISTSFVIPSNAPVGDYTIRISPSGTQKAIQDSQTFTIAGYAVTVKTVNLAGEVVPDVDIQVLDTSTNTPYKATSGADGTALFKLEKGTYALTAYWNGVNVGASNVTVTGDGAFTLSCQLSDIKFTVKNTDGIAMPFVNLNIVYNYGSGKSGSVAGQTNPSGSYTLKSTLAQASYRIDASIYGQVFNAGNNSVGSLPTQATAEVVIICPSENFTVNVVGYNQEPIPSARIELVELSNGLFYSTTTDSSGVASLQPTFGSYRARVYKDNVLVNEINLQVFNSSQRNIRCTLYGIQLKVSVVDLFGVPVSKVNVTLNGPEKVSQLTGSDGVATFNNIIGGNMQIIAQASGNQEAYQAVTLTVSEPSSVQVKMEKYVAFGSMLVPATLLITVIIIVAAVIAFLVVELYVRRRAKHASTA